MEKYIYRELVNYDFNCPAVLCSVVDWKGSVPRRDFPVMLVLESGDTIGTVGGGTMEYQVIELAKSVLESGKTLRKQFDMTGSSTESDKSLCGGNTQVVVEPYTVDIQELWTSLDFLAKPTNHQVLITVSGFNPAVVHRLIIDPGMKIEFPEHILDLLEMSREQGRSISRENKDELLFIQYIAPQPRLHIFGAGHVGQAVAELAYFVELETLIYDDRPELNTRERFPHASTLVTSPIAELVSTTEIIPEDFALIVSHGHRNDFELMKWLLGKKTAWLGLLSSKRKWKILSESLIDEGFTPEQIQTVHSPVGMNIGSETVPEIAVSIIAELIHQLRVGGRSIQSLSVKEKRDVAASV